MVNVLPKPLQARVTGLTTASNTTRIKVGGVPVMRMRVVYKLELRRTTAGSQDVVCTLKETVTGQTLDSVTVTLDQNKYVQVVLSGTMDNVKDAGELLVDFDAAVDELAYSYLIERHPMFGG